MRAEPDAPAPVLVLGLGNRLLGDDGLGPELAELLERECRADPRVEFLDGGTQGLALLGYLEGRAALLVLDAAAFGAAPGTVHTVADPLAVRMARGHGAHEGNAGELLAAALLLGTLPPAVVLVGVEPGELETRIGLSPAVRAALPRALASARSRLEALLQGTEVAPCTS